VLFAGLETARDLGARRISKDFVSVEEREAELEKLVPLLAGHGPVGYFAWDPDKGRLFKSQYTVAPTILVADRAAGVERLLVEREHGQKLALDRATWRLVARSPNGRFAVYERRRR
jgi:hypothetical protein